MSEVCFVCSMPILSHQVQLVQEPGLDYYHEECLRCSNCGMILSGANIRHARRYQNRFYCEKHFHDLLLDSEKGTFIAELREFKKQSLGCAAARRKSSTTLQFPPPPQACYPHLCEYYPHSIRPMPGYWIECHVTNVNSRDFNTLNLKSAEEIYNENGTFELTSYDQETYGTYFHGSEHWNYFTTDEALGPVILSLKQEMLNNREQFRIMVRSVSYTVHGLVPASCVFANRYDREEVVQSLGNEISLNPPLQLGQLPTTADDLLKLDQIFIKSELKVGVIYVKEHQTSEEQILNNTAHTDLFDEFLNTLGDKVRLRGFDKYRGGLDTVHDLTGSYAVYTQWKGIEIMFHVSTLLPYEQDDPQKLQRKRHIGNDVVCLVFLEADRTDFSPSSIKSHFLHTFVIVKTSCSNRENPTKYEVSVVSRDEVPAYTPYLLQQHRFENGSMFREWLLSKIVNGERASYTAPKFARMQDRTRSQMLEDIVTNLQNHVETGQMPKAYRRGSWRPIGHMRSTSPLLDSVRDVFESYDQLSKDFAKAFQNNNMCDVTFIIGKEKTKLYGVRAILAVRSRVFQDILYGSTPTPALTTTFSFCCGGVGGQSNNNLQNTLLLPPLPSNNFLQVPDIAQRNNRSAPTSPVAKRAFIRLSSFSLKRDRDKTVPDDVEQYQALALAHDKLRRCKSEMNWFEKTPSGAPAPLSSIHLVSPWQLPAKELPKEITVIDRHKLLQTEFVIEDFDTKTFKSVLGYLHTGSCTLTCLAVPGLISAAEHYDLPELLQACFHHTKQFLNTGIVCIMLKDLERYYYKYNSAMEIVTLILQYVESHATEIFSQNGFLELSERYIQMIMSSNLHNVTELEKFHAMVAWAKNQMKKHNRRGTQDLREIMERVSHTLKFHLIPANDLIKIIQPTKAISNERIMNALMHQAKLGHSKLTESQLQRLSQDSD